MQGDSVENSPAPSGIAETLDPLRHVQTWHNSAAEGMLDNGDLDLLQHFINLARKEIRESFVPLAVAVRMAERGE